MQQNHNNHKEVASVPAALASPPTSYIMHNYAYLQPLTQKVPPVFNASTPNHSQRATVTATADAKHANESSTDRCTATTEVNELAVEAAESKEQDEQRILPSDEIPNGVTNTTKEEEEVVMVEEDKNDRNENNASDSAEEGNFF